MKIRSKEELVECLNDDIAWRKKELTTLKINVERSRNKLLDTAIRSGIVLLYAHWEGFIKKAAEAYLMYVESRRLKYCELKTNFIALSLKQKLVDFQQTNKSSIHTQMIDFILYNEQEVARINYNNVIKTGSNLNSIILKEIITTIGIDFGHYETKSNLIDEQLLNYRNNIAHGQHLEIDLKSYISLHDLVRGMIETFKTDIENATVLESFIRE